MCRAAALLIDSINGINQRFLKQSFTRKEENMVNEFSFRLITARTDQHSG